MRTFLDAGIVITASGSVPDPRDRNLRDHRLALGAYDGSLFVLTDPARTKMFTPFVELEVLPSAEYDRARADELAIRRGFLHDALPVKATLEELYRRARELGREIGVSGIDALHLAGAEIGGCDELVTTERRGAMFRANDLRPLRVRVIDVRTLAPGGA